MVQRSACWCDLPEDPRVASSDQVSYATYYTWMAECVSQPARYVDHDRCINPEHLADLMRFRVGSHWLSVVTGRWTDGGTGVRVPVSSPPLAGASQEKGYRYPRCLDNGFVCSMG